MVPLFGQQALSHPGPVCMPARAGTTWNAISRLGLSECSVSFGRIGRPCTRHNAISLAMSFPVLHDNSRLGSGELYLLFLSRYVASCVSMILPFSSGCLWIQVRSEFSSTLPIHSFAAGPPRLFSVPRQHTKRRVSRTCSLTGNHLLPERNQQGLWS